MSTKKSTPRKKAAQPQEPETTPDQTAAEEPAEPEPPAAEAPAAEAPAPAAEAEAEQADVAEPAPEPPAATAEQSETEPIEAGAAEAAEAAEAAPEPPAPAAAEAEQADTAEVPAPPPPPAQVATAAAPPPPPPPASHPGPGTPPRRARRPVALAATAVAVAAVLGAGLGATLTAALTSGSTATTTVVENARNETATPTVAPGESLSVTGVYSAVAAGVVEISTTGGGSSSLPSPFGQDEPQTRGQGSGFVYDDQGRIVTNHHVVDGATSIEVRLADGATYPARLIGSDASTDLAVLAIDAPAGALHPVPLGDSAALQVGEQVVAIGSPFGLEATVTTGIVSALDRRITAPNGFAIPNAIQTDAAINRGNSGGPLLNMRGEVVGVNSQIESQSGGNVGIGFAVPSSTVRDVVSQLLATGSVQHAFLGVSVETIPTSAAGELGEAAGAAVAQVREGSPAATASLQAATGTQTVAGIPYPTGGDVITAVDAETIATAEELQNAIAARRPGDVVTLTVVRAGQTRSVDVTLTNRPS